MALKISEKTNGQVWFSNLDLKNAYSQLKVCEKTSKQCLFSIVGGKTTGTYLFLTGFYGLIDIPNEFQRVMDSVLKNKPFTNCYIDDILVASKGSLKEHKATIHKILTILDKNNMGLNWGKCASSESQAREYDRWLVKQMPSRIYQSLRAFRNCDRFSAQ